MSRSTSCPRRSALVRGVAPCPAGLEAVEDCDVVIDHGGPLGAMLVGRSAATALHAVHGPLGRAMLPVDRALAGARRGSGRSRSARAAPARLPFAGVCHIGIDMEPMPFRSEPGDHLLSLGRMSPDKGPGRGDRDRPRGRPPAGDRRQVPRRSSPTRRGSVPEVVADCVTGFVRDEPLALALGAAHRRGAAAAPAPPGGGRSSARPPPPMGGDGVAGGGTISTAMPAGRSPCARPRRAASGTAAWRRCCRSTDERSGRSLAEPGPFGEPHLVEDLPRLLLAARVHRPPLAGGQRAQRTEHLAGSEARI